jgi:hypothetical protein
MKRIMQLVFLTAILLTSVSFSQLSEDGKSYLLKTNSVSIPFSNNGIIADVRIDTSMEADSMIKISFFGRVFFNRKEWEFFLVKCFSFGIKNTGLPAGAGRLQP